MNARQLQQLVDLRLLREQRAARRLAQQRQQQRLASEALAEACAALTEQQEQQRQLAERLTARLATPLPVSHWQRGQDAQAASAEDTAHCLTQVSEASVRLALHRADESAQRRALLRCQGQREASEQLLERHRPFDEPSDPADEGLAPAYGQVRA